MKAKGKEAKPKPKKGKQEQDDLLPLPTLFSVVKVEEYRRVLTMLAQAYKALGEIGKLQASGRQVLTDNEYTILLELKAKYPRTVLIDDLSASTKIGERTCKKVVAALIRRGLAERRSKKSGVSLTGAGEALLRACT